MSLSRNQSGGLLAALVTIANKTNQKSSYAMRVDFADSAGKAVDTGFVGAGKREPGHKEEPVAFGGQPQGIP
ncbi:hypothetical protein ACWCYL_32075 [Streptomyces sp. 900105755]